MSAKLFEFVRGQHRAFFRDMAISGVRWHLYRVPGTDSYPMLREDAPRDAPMDIAVHNVHAMTESTLAVKFSDYLKR